MRGKTTCKPAPDSRHVTASMGGRGFCRAPSGLKRPAAQQELRPPDVCLHNYKKHKILPSPPPGERRGEGEDHLQTCTGFQARNRIHGRARLLPSTLRAQTTCGSAGASPSRRVPAQPKKHKILPSPPPVERRGEGEDHLQTCTGFQARNRIHGRARLLPSPLRAQKTGGSAGASPSRRVPSQLQKTQNSPLAPTGGEGSGVRGNNTL